MQESDGESSKWASFQIPSKDEEAGTASKMIELDEQYADSDGAEDDRR